MTAENYSACLLITLDFEGGYSNDVGDPGGPTKYGITIHDVRMYLDPHATAETVKMLTIGQAKEIYRKHYWEPIHGDDLPEGVDLAVFDYGVNSGVRRVAKVVQKLVGTPADGIIGPHTLAAIGDQEPAELIERICDERLDFLEGLRTWHYFGKGWGRRVRAIKKLGLAMAQRQSKGGSDASVGNSDK